MTSQLICRPEQYLPVAILRASGVLDDLTSQALEHAHVAELEAGDAIYIPPLWWHHVESLERLNALVNYWWKGSPDAPSDAPSAFEALHASLKAFRDATPEQRAAWDALFGHFVFKRE